MGLNIFRFIACLTMILVVSACSQVTDNRQKKIFSDIHNSYKNAILWSDFEYASSFQKTDSQSRVKPDPMYNNIKVTAYDEKGLVFDFDKQRIEQTVSIQYYWIDQMIEKRILVNSIWEWDKTSKTWYLVSKLPNFE